MQTVEILTSGFDTLQWSNDVGANQQNLQYFRLWSPSRTKPVHLFVGKTAENMLEAASVCYESSTIIQLEY